MNDPKTSQLTTTRRDIPAARRLQETRASALRPEDRPSGVQRAAAPDAVAPNATATQEDESESEDASADAVR